VDTISPLQFFHFCEIVQEDNNEKNKINHRSFMKCFTHFPYHEISWIKGKVVDHDNSINSFSPTYKIMGVRIPFYYFILINEKWVKQKQKLGHLLFFPPKL